MADNLRVRAGTIFDKTRYPLTPSEPRIVGTTTVPCATCGRMGYHDDGDRCAECGGSGALLVEIVACPVHSSHVARANDGTLLGACDGCAAETARALQFLSISRNTTGLRDSRLGASVAQARRDHLR